MLNNLLKSSFFLACIRHTKKSKSKRAALRARSPAPGASQILAWGRVSKEKVLDKAASDATWKQRLLDDPEAAMQEANFPESQQLDELRQEDDEVIGHQRWLQHTDSLGSAPVAGECYHQCRGAWPTYWSA